MMALAESSEIQFILRGTWESEPNLMAAIPIPAAYWNKPGQASGQQASFCETELDFVKA